MKRLIIGLLMPVFFLFILIGCEKDEVVAPEAKEDVKQSEELVQADVEKQDKAIKEESAEESSPAKDEEAEAVSSQQDPKQDDKSTMTEQKKVEASPEKKSSSPQPSKETAPDVKEAPAADPKPSAEGAETKPKAEPTKPKTEPTKPKTEPTKPPAEATKPPAEPTKPKQTVTITIVAPGVKETILPVTSVEFEEGDTVLSITQQIVRARGIQISVTGAGATAYVQGIDNLYEFDHGPLSGWEAFVDGQTLDRSAGIYGVQPGQAIMWRYTKNYTE